MSVQQQKKIKGLALVCSQSGHVLEVLQNDFDLLDSNLKGLMFTSLVDTSNLQKALDLMVEIRNKQIALDYQLNVMLRESIETLYFMGLVVGEQIIIIAAESYDNVLELINKLQQINNEQINQIRRYAKENIQLKEKIVDENRMFEEISRLNNELINLQRELSKKNTELAKLNDLKNRFLGMASHDLRNPLNVISAYSEFLLDEAKDSLSEEHLKFIKTIHSSASFMFNMVNDLLDVSKIESGKLQLMKQKLDLILLLKNNIELNQILASKKKIQIDFATSTSQISIEADKAKMEQVFNNLLSNAIKFSHQNTTVQVSVSQENDTVSISVKDSGIGIAEEFIDKIFIPFEKASKQGTEGEKCTGLGLSIVKRIVEGHGGTITVDSKSGIGSTFSIHIPLK